MNKWSKKSLANLETCHPDLQRLFNKVLEDRDCTVICGFRSKEDQDEAYRTGHSTLKWPNSKHNQIPSRAVDVMPYPIDWNDTDRIIEFANWVELTASLLGINVTWGGRWTGFPDMPHYELKEAL